MLKLVGKHYFEYNKKHKLKILKTIYYVEGTYIYIYISINNWIQNYKN